MNAKQKIIEVIEARKREVVEKNLRHKLMAIASTMGEPILVSSASSAMASDDALGVSIYMERNEFYENESESEELIPTGEEYFQKPVVLGWHFDALRWGANIQVSHRPQEGLLFVTLDGHMVFREEFGELMAYVPMEAWESRIDHWAAIAEKRLQNRKKEEEKEIAREQKSILEHAKAYLTKFWGLDFEKKDR